MVTTRDRIIAATNELFRHQGYNGTSLSQIGEASSTTTGSIYHSFPGGKEELAVAVIETTGAVYRQLFEAITAEASDPVSAYRDFFVAAAAVLEESGFIDPCPIGTIAREVANTSEPLRQAADRAFTSWIDAAQQHLESAGVPAETAAEFAYMFVTTVEGTFVVSRTQRTTKPLEATGRHLSELVERTIDEAVAVRP